ncbi:hypothetical protein VTO73DRAFT_11226 [Trametes versicolor]
MPPRRNRPTTNIHGPTATQNVPPPTQRTQTPAGTTQRQLGMLPTVYQSNMKVLLRREPYITAIIDQFSHVCLYHHNGQKWEKHGYEGSMFLFEKSTYPTYGFYILNRAGTDDYIRPIYPEDDMEIMGDYLMCRFYPDLTKTRLEMGLPFPIPPEHRAAFDHELSRRIPPEEQAKPREKKGTSIILGLWMFPTDAREPLKEVMMRLHSYVKRNADYPEEFKYGPGRPPPPNPHLRTTSRASTHTPSQDQGDTLHAGQPNGVSHSQTLPSVEQAAAATNGAGTELDLLFSKLIPPSVSAPLPTSSSVGPPSGKSVYDLFAALGGNDMTSRSVPPPQPLSVPEPPPSRGLALLDSIFASATPATSSTSINSFATPTQPQPRFEEITIVSPKPTSSALPQILNQDVIHTLLGLGPDSRASSAAPSSVGSRRSNPNRYEGDNENSEGELALNGAASSRSRTSDRKVNGRTAGIPSFSVQSVQNTASSESEADDVGRPSSSRRVPGDVTPRPPAGGLRLPPTSPPQFLHQPSVPTASLSAPNLRVPPNGIPTPDTPSGTRGERALVPFEASSELWPYPRAPLDDRSFENDDVVELDFSDTRALSDPAIFSSRLKDKQQKKKGRKSRKERDEDNVRQRAEIERGWDMPSQGHGQPSYPPTAKTAVAAMAPPNGVTVVPNGAPSVVNGTNANVNGTTPKTNGAIPNLNGATAAMTPNDPGADSTPKQTRKVVVNGSNGAPHVNGQSRNGALDSISAKEAIFAAMNAHVPAPAPTIPKTEFVRELLTLIHTDSQFVDGLWKDYTTRAA